MHLSCTFWGNHSYGQSNFTQKRQGLLAILPISGVDFEMKNQDKDQKSIFWYFELTFCQKKFTTAKSCLHGHEEHNQRGGPAAADEAREHQRALHVVEEEQAKQHHVGQCLGRWLGGGFGYMFCFAILLPQNAYLHCVLQSIVPREYKNSNKKSHTKRKCSTNLHRGRVACPTVCTVILFSTTDAAKLVCEKWKVGQMEGGTALGCLSRDDTIA